MANDALSGLEQRVYNCVARVGTFDGDPVTAICRQLGSQSTPIGSQLVQLALRSLHDQGKLAVYYTDGVVSRVSVVATRQPLGRPETAEGWRQRIYARYVPSHLRDDQCSPVEVTRMSPEAARRRARGETPVSVLAYREDVPYHVNLTTCLTALREMANDQGVGESLSVRAVLLELVDGMTGSRADRAMEHLYGLGLYKTQLAGWQRRDYTVDLTVPEVTEQMLVAYRAAVSDRTKSRTGSTVESQAESASDGDVVTQLLAIIEELEGRLRTSEAELAQCQAELEAARAELRRRVAPEDPRIREVLARYPR